MPTKRTTSQKTVRVSEPLPENETFQSGVTARFPKQGKKFLLIGLVVVILAGIFYFLANQLIVALVNGRPVTRWEVVKALEAQAGKQTFDALLTKTLILQEAQKQKVTVSDEEINQEIKKIEDSVTAQGQNLDQLLAAQGMTREELGVQIKLKKIVEKLVGSEAGATDQEIDDYIKNNKDMIPQSSDSAAIKSSVKQQLEQQKMNKKIQELIQSLKDKAKIYYIRNY